MGIQGSRKRSFQPHIRCNLPAFISVTEGGVRVAPPAHMKTKFSRTVGSLRLKVICTDIRIVTI